MKSDKEIRFAIGNDYECHNKEGFVERNHKIYCAMCGELAIVDKSYHDRDEYCDYYCKCEGSKLFSYIEKLKCDLRKFTSRTDAKFKILDLQKKQEKLQCEFEESEKEIKKLEAYLK